MADFKIALEATGRVEGGLSDSKADSGGLTWRGIASTYWPTWAGWPTVRQIIASVNGDIAAANKLLYASKDLQALVDTFYKKNFWDIYGLDGVSDQAIANEIYDTGVNMGTGVESKFLQRALNVTNKNQKLYPDLVVDGVIGAKTIATLNSHPNKKQVLKVLNILQGAKYISIMESNPSQEVFADTWFSRVTI